MKNKLYDLIIVFGCGVGQVLFQANAFSGLLMLLGIFLGGWQMLLLALGGNMASMLTAYLLGFNRDEIKKGLYGFNGTLVGIAVGVFMTLTPLTIVLMVLASSFSTGIVWLFKRQNLLPLFTVPFILSVWLLLGVCHCWMPQYLLQSASVALTGNEVDCLQSLGAGIGQVMFQGNSLSGLCFLVAILFHSRIGAFYAIVGALLPVLLSLLIGVDAPTINMGLVGYNGVLCAMALGGKNLASLGWAIGAVVLSVLLQLVGMEWGIPTLTAPFVMSVWIMIVVKKMLHLN